MKAKILPYARTVPTFGIVLAIEEIIQRVGREIGLRDPTIFHTPHGFIMTTTWKRDDPFMSEEPLGPEC